MRGKFHLLWQSWIYGILPFTSWLSKFQSMAWRVYMWSTERQTGRWVNAKYHRKCDAIARAIVHCLHMLHPLFKRNNKYSWHTTIYIYAEFGVVVIKLRSMRGSNCSSRAELARLESCNYCLKCWVIWLLLPQTPCICITSTVSLVAKIIVICVM